MAVALALDLVPPPAQEAPLEQTAAQAAELRVAPVVVPLAGLAASRRSCRVWIASFSREEALRLNGGALSKPLPRNCRLQRRN